MSVAETSPEHAGAPPGTGRIVAVGLLAGFTSGLFGVGGGIVIVPALVALAGFGQRRAHATSLAAIVVISTSGAIGYANAGEIDWSIAAAMTAGGLFGAPLGARLLDRISERTLKLGFAALLVVTAIRLLVGDPGAEAMADIGALQLAGFGALGFLGGLAAGLMGVGGGIITVPVLTIIGGFPLVLAKGTSLAVIAPTAVVGSIRNHQAGHVSVRAAVLVGAGGVVSAALASQFSLELDPRLSSILFAGLLLLTAARMARRALTARSA